MKPATLLIYMWIACALAACGGRSPEPEPHSDAEHGESEESHEDEHGSQHNGKLARISAEAASAAGIQISEAGPAKLRESLSLYGVIALNAERTRNVSARFAGVVRSVAASVGDQVWAGQSIASIESNESLQVYSVAAPIAGVITARNTNAGESVADQPLFTVADLSSVWVELSAFPREAGKLRVGQTVRVASTDGAVTGVGRIAFVSALGSSATQSTSARVVLENAERRWTPGLYVSAEVVLQEVAAGVAVKNEALQTIDGARAVFVEDEGGFVARAVRTGRSDTEVTEIIEGLDAGERYVSANSFVVKSELEKAGAEHEH